MACFGAAIEPAARFGVGIESTARFGAGIGAVIEPVAFSFSAGIEPALITRRQKRALPLLRFYVSVKVWFLALLALLTLERSGLPQMAGPIFLPTMGQGSRPAVLAREQG